MKLDTLFLIYIGYFMHISIGNGHGKDVHIKINVPDVVHQHNHKYTVYKKSPQRDNGGYEAEFVAGNDGEKANILENEHGNEHEYKHEHKPYHKQSTKEIQSEKHKHNKEDKENDDDFNAHLDNFKEEPDKNADHEDFDEGPVVKKTGKSVHTEHYEVKKINPDAKFPDEKYVIKGSYKVQETDPFFDFTTTSVHAYDDPISKIAAKILTNYDYTNFGPYSGDREFTDFSNSGEKEEQRDDLGEPNVEGYSNKDGTYGLGKEHDYSRNYPSHGKYDDHAENEDIYSYSNRKYENKDKKKGTPVYSNDYLSREEDDNYDPKKENIHTYSKITPHQEKHKNNAKNGKAVKVLDHSIAYPNQNDVEYDVAKAIFNDYSKIPLNLEKSEVYGQEKTEIPDFSVRPNYENLIKSDPSYNYGGKKVEYFVIPSFREVETKSNSYDYDTHPNYHRHQELDYFVNPSHSDNLYDKNWKDYIIRTVYGNDYAASNQFARKATPEKTKKSK